MMRLNCYFLLILTCLFSVGLSAQNNAYPQTTVGGKAFYIYKVDSGEGLFAICRKFNLTQEEVVRHNPTVKTGLRGGQQLLIPIVNDTDATKNDKKGFTHTVEAGQTVYSISKTYQISIEKITEWNPASANGISPGDILKLQQHDSIVTLPEATDVLSFLYHTILPKETLYSVAKKFNTKQETLLEMNPGLTIESFSVGKVIRVQPGEPQPQPRFTQYTLKKKENIYSVSSKFNVPVDVLMACNKNVHIQPNTTINIPDTATVRRMTDKGQTIVQQQAPARKFKGTYDVVVMLPFMLNSKDTKTPLYVEFYQGLLLAAHRMKDNGLNLNIHAFDTEGSNAVVGNLLEKKEIANADLIIGPASDELLKVVASYGQKHQIPIVNPFSLKNDEVFTNSQLFQINIQHPFLYNEVAKEFAHQNGYKDIVFLTDKKQKADKTDLIELMKAELIKSKTHFRDYTFTEDKEITQLDSLLSITNRNLVVVPTNGSKVMAAKVTNALSIMKMNRPEVSIDLFGYPEWQTYSKDFIENFHNLNTTIFSRIYVNPMDDHVKQFISSFREWYGKELINATPVYGMMGYDTGLYFLEQLKQNGKTFVSKPSKSFQDNLQTDFNFVRASNWGGFLNKGLYFINFTPENTIKRERIR